MRLSRTSRHLPAQSRLLPRCYDSGVNPVRSAEIVAVGTELLLGEINDTNSAFLARELAARGVDVFWSLRVGDNMSRIRSAIRTALARSDLLVLTGGLGPTEDDMTREAVAAETGETPAVDPEQERVLRARFERSGRSMPERNLKQAWTIPSATVLANPNGTAPGWLVSTVVAGQERFIVTLPGPPREMMPMWHNEVLPRLELPESRLLTRTFKTAGLGESDIADALDDVTHGSNPSVATYARSDGVHVRVAAKAPTEEAAMDLARPVLLRVGQALGGHVWGMDADDLGEVVSRMLLGRGVSIAAAGDVSGPLGEALAAPGDSHGPYRGGMVAWSPQALGLLGIVRQAAGSTSGSSGAVLLADAARATFSADIGLATSRWDPAADGPEGTDGGDGIHIAVTSADDRIVRRLDLRSADAAWRRERILVSALHLLWTTFRGSPADN